MEERIIRLPELITYHQIEIQEGFDADLCVLDQGLEIQEVIARGKSVYRK